ncbi:hypothetical protein QJQ45_003237 [Haematococcus lacustris]|nr:hypothetical protein QJQ45_003237 [Haematococcus lacustris]
MARKKRRTGVGGPRAVPEDPDFDIVDRVEAAQPDLTEAQRKRKASGEARAARSRDNTFHASPTPMCRFYDRDVSAALNIRRCAVGPGPRPTELCYWNGRPAMPKPGQPGQEWVEIPDKPLLLKWQRQLQQ